MSITEAAITRNRITITFLLIVLAGGILAFRALPRAEDPGFIVRTAMIVTYFPGASPERVEMLITDKLERVVQEIPELERIRSESRTGVSIVYPELDARYTDLQPIWDRMRRKIDRVRPDLPENIIGPIVDDEFGDVFGIVLTLTGDGFSYAELKDVADEMRDELLYLEDSAKVDIYGAQEERVFIEFNNARLAEIGLSPYALLQLIETRNVIIPGGSIVAGAERLVLEPSGNFETLDDLRETVISLPGLDQVVFLGDLATISRGYVDPPESKMHYNGERALGLAVSMREGGNIIQLGQEVEELVSRLLRTYPIGIEIDSVAFEPDEVQRKVRDLNTNLAQSLIIIVVVMLISLGLRTGFLVASTIPMSVLLTYLCMHFLDIGLDQVSIGAIIIALGMLVDNAIVMSESILVQIRSGKRAMNAAIDSARELRIPLLTSSLITSTAFLPIFIAQSETGEYTRPLFEVVTITLLSSWILALTMTPLMCVYLLKIKKKPAAAEGRLKRWAGWLKPRKRQSKLSKAVEPPSKQSQSEDKNPYDTRFYYYYRRFLLTLLRNRFRTAGAAALAFAAALFAFQFVPFLFFPPSDRATFTVDLEFPPGTPIERTREAVESIETFIDQELRAGSAGRRGVTNWASFVGEGGPRYLLNYVPEPPRPEYGFMLINVTDHQHAPGLIQQLREYCVDAFPEALITIRSVELGPPVGNPIQVRVSGPDMDTLYGIVEDVRAKMGETPGVRNISDDWGPRVKKLKVNVNQPRALRASVSSMDVAVSLQTILDGFEITPFREDDETIPIVARSVSADRDDVGKLEALNVYSQVTGQAVPLSQVAGTEVVWEPSRILRRDRMRTITVESDLSPTYRVEDVNRVLRPWLAQQQQQWPTRYSYAIGGEAEASEEANASIIEQLHVAGFLILLLLVIEFNSFRRTLITVLTIPLGVTGVVLGLLITGSYFGFMTLLGIISLAGIVVKNAIVLIERIELEESENQLDPATAIVEASQRRLRPILLTTLTTTGGLMPLWLWAGPMWTPLAVTIIFGLLCATVLMLGVVPALYALMFRVRYDNFEYAPPAMRNQEEEDNVPYATE